MNVPASINITAREIVALTDLGEVKEIAAKAGTLAQYMKRSGKFTGTDYYRVAEARIWAEWRGGGLLRDVERAKPGPKDMSDDATQLNGLYATINRHQLKKDTAYRWIAMSYCPEDTLTAYIAKQKSASKEIKSSDVVRIGKEHQPQEQPAIGDDYEIIHADLIDADIADESVDCIITDPPYPKEFIGEYEKLSTFAARVLKPGGYCLAMAGQSYVPEIVSSLGKYLTYHWTIAYLTPGGQSVQQWGRHVNTFWKPVFWFVKGEFDGQWVGDVVKSDVNDNDKRFHEWGQSESGMARLVENFSRPNDLILDPFVGGGTTAIAALSRGRRFIGIDREQAAIDETLRRIAGLAGQADAA